MKRISLLILSHLLVASAMAQCSICTKTAGQIGQEAGKGSMRVYYISQPCLLPLQAISPLNGGSRINHNPLNENI